MNAGSVATALQHPANVADTGARHGIDQNDFAGGKAARLNPRQVVTRDTGRAVQRAVVENVTVVCLRIADLCVIRVRAHGTGMTILKEGWTGSSHEVHIAFDVAVPDVRLRVGRIDGEDCAGASRPGSTEKMSAGEWASTGHPFNVGALSGGVGSLVPACVPQKRLTEETYSPRERDMAPATPSESRREQSFQ